MEEQIETQKEFNLSEKIVNADGFTNCSTDKVFFEEDVKEFIRLLKELTYYPLSDKEMRDQIDKLAGEKLT